jgi:hypothetical protein
LAVELAELELPLVLVVVLELLPLLHAAAAVAVATASAATASARLLRMVVSWKVMAQGTFESFRILSTCRHRKLGANSGQPLISTSLRAFSCCFDCRTMQQEQRCSTDCHRFENFEL